MKRTYEIHPRPANLGGGWKLTLLEDGVEAGGGVFALPEEDTQPGVEWWNSITDERRTHWLMMAASVIPAAARHAYLVAEAWNDAFEEGESWAS